MARLKLSVSSTMIVVPSDAIDIPNISTRAFDESTATASTLGKLTDTSQNFLTNGTKVGDIVQVDSTLKKAKITVIDSATVCTLSGGAVVTGNVYSIYSEATRDAVFYVGVTGDVEYIDSGGNLNIMKAAPVGWHPVNVKRILDSNTTATDILAGW